MRKYLGTSLMGLILIVFITIGCSSKRSLFNPEASLFGGKRVTLASANQIFGPDFEEFNDQELRKLLDPHNEAKVYLDQKRFNNSSEGERDKYLLRLAFWVANHYTNDKNDVSHRSQIQDRLIAVSNQRCNLYATYLKRVSSYNNGIFGTLTTILGGAGAIVTGEEAARILSGLAGISSGTRAELNDAMFESIATSVIVPAIQKIRSEFLDKMLQKRSKTLEDYTVEGAIADAIEYHGLCSMDAGIAHAQKSIQSYDDIGIKKFIENQAQLGLARSLSEPSIVGNLAVLTVAEKALDDVKKQLDEYKPLVDKLEDNKEEQKKVKNKYTGLLGEFDKGVLREEAKRLDDELKTAIFDFASAAGSNKSDKFSILDSQQLTARNYVKRIEAKKTGFFAELQQFLK